MKEISIMYLMQLAWKRIWALAIALIFFAGVALAYCELIAVPQYTATASVIVTNGAIITGKYETDYDSEDTLDSKGVQSTDITASLNLVKTIVDILKTNDIYIKLAESLDNKYSSSQLKSMATVAHRENGTLFVDVSFKTTSSSESVLISNTFVELSCDYITEYIPNSYARVASTASGASQVFPKTLTTTVMAGLIGVIVAFSIVLIIDLSDKAIRGEQDFVASFDIPLIGIVPDFEDDSIINSYGKKRRYYGGYKTKSYR